MAFADSTISISGNSELYPLGPPNLLTLPLELRLRIYELIFTPQTIRVEVDPPRSYGEESYYDCRMPHVPGLSAQFLRTCRQVQNEAGGLLYSANAFECSGMEGMQLLLKTVGAHPFMNLTTLTLDWDCLFILALSLSRPCFVALTRSLTNITLATWRTRVLGGSSSHWRQAKSYERTLCQSALEILAKSTRLAMLVQRPYHGTKAVGGTGSNWAAGSTVVGLRRPTTYRIKWRFLAEEAQMGPDEVGVDLEAELMALGPEGGETGTHVI